ncbi:MAG TPA: GtrA family protein [Candidatus Saccharimonadales bacterium]|nr:GtrA family protein [Candidatus Saccharimonadales bacterium]
MLQLTQLLKRPGYRYLIIGGSVYLFELAVIVVAQRLGASAVWAVAISFCLGTLVSFFLQKLVTFGDKRMHHRILIPQMVATALLIVWNLTFSVLLTKLLQQHLPAVITRTLALGITTVWNFYLYKTHIFKQSEALVAID